MLKMLAEHLSDVAHSLFLETALRLFEKLQRSLFLIFFFNKGKGKQLCFSTPDSSVYRNSVELYVCPFHISPRTWYSCWNFRAVSVGKGKAVIELHLFFMAGKNSSFDEGSKKPCESKEQNKPHQCELAQGIQTYECSDESAGDLAFCWCSHLLTSWQIMCTPLGSVGLAQPCDCIKWHHGKMFIKNNVYKA